METRHCFLSDGDERLRARSTSAQDGAGMLLKDVVFFCCGSVDLRPAGVGHHQWFFFLSKRLSKWFDAGRLEKRSCPDNNFWKCWTKRCSVHQSWTSALKQLSSTCVSPEPEDLVVYGNKWTNEAVSFITICFLNVCVVALRWRQNGDTVMMTRCFSSHKFCQNNPLSLIISHFSTETISKTQLSLKVVGWNNCNDLYEQFFHVMETWKQSAADLQLSGSYNSLPLFASSPEELQLMSRVPLCSAAAVGMQFFFLPGDTSLNLSSW